MPMRDIDMIVVHCSGSRCDFTTVFRASGPSWGIAICLAFRKPVRVLTPRSSSTSWMLPDPLKLRGLFKSRNPPNLFNKLGRIQAGCALFLCRHISFSQHSTFNIQHSTSLYATCSSWYIDPWNNRKVWVDKYCQMFCRSIWHKLKHNTMQDHNLHL